MEWVALTVALVTTSLWIRERFRARSHRSEFRSLVDGSPAPIVVFDDTTVLYVNDRVVATIGAEGPSSLKGKSLGEVLAPDTAQLARVAYQRVIESGSPLSIKDFMVAGRSGVEVLCDLSFAPVGFGGATAVQCAFNPVDEKHAALVALHETEKRFKSFFDEMPVPMYRTRPDGTVLHANEALSSLLGFDNPSDLIGVSASAFYEDPEYRASLAQTQVDEGLLTDQISTLVAVDGRRIWVRDSSRTVSENGQEVFEGALVDVTKEQLSSQLLERRATQQQALADMARNALKESDAGSVLDQAVDQICQVLGAGCALVAQHQPGLGLIATSVAYQVDSVRERERLLRYLQAKVATIPDREEPIALDSDEGPGSETLRGVQIAVSGPSEAYGVIGVAGVDLMPTDEDLDFLTATAATLGSAVSRSRSRARMARLMRSKDEFVASVSHELRTPLTVVAGLALEMERGWREFSDDELAEFIGLIADQSREMGDLIEDLLVAARADIGKVPILAEAVELQSCIEQVVATCALGDRARIAIGGESVIGFVDPVRCRQIIRNLVTNAVRYGGPRIRVSAQHANGQAQVVVYDDGAGVAKNDREKMFAPYERAHTADGGGVPGSVGLGLTVSRKLTELMGGSISYRYDGGSYFEVRLPLAEDSATAG